MSGVRYPGPAVLLLTWCGVGALSSSRFFFVPARYEPFELHMMLVWMACYAPWALLSPVAFCLERRWPLGGPRWAGHLLGLVAGSLVVSVLGAALMHVTVSFVWMALGGSPVPRSAAWIPIHEVPVALACFWVSVAAGYSIRTRHQLREHERREARLALEKSRLEAGLNQAQLEVLRAKLNPHFLFNSLQNISVLTRQDPDTASRMLTRLGDLLRSVLRQDSSPESTLREEIDLTQAYVALEQLRFGDRMRVEFTVAPDAWSAMVPPFLLQPLIENAVIHGLRAVRKDGLICVSASCAGPDLVLHVTDNGVGVPVTGPSALKVGVGLGSTRERLERMYPNAHTFTIGPAAGGGTDVRITLPLRSAATSEAEASS